MPPHLTDVLEVLDVHALGVHDLLDDVGPHLPLALAVFVAVAASVLLLPLALGGAGILRQLFLIDSQLWPTQRGQVTGGRQPWGQAGLPGFHLSPTRATPCQRLKTQQECQTTSLLQLQVFLRPS